MPIGPLIQFGKTVAMFVAVQVVATLISQKIIDEINSKQKITVIKK